MEILKLKIFFEIKTRIYLSRQDLREGFELCSSFLTIDMDNNRNSLKLARTIFNFLKRSKH